MIPTWWRVWWVRWRAWRTARFERDVISTLQVSQEWQRRRERLGRPR
jgi:hypothetical protein